jgi:glycosyltransferase involved in cell wall biosynthesis
MLGNGYYKVRILQVIDSLAAGGAERLLVDVINGMPQAEHHLIVLNGPETLRPELPATCRFVNLQRKSSKEIWKHARTVKKYIKLYRIDIVHAHLFFSCVVGRLATPKKNPLFNSIHNTLSLDNYTKNRLALYLEKLTYRKHHHLLGVSKEVLDDFDKWVGLKGPHTVLHNFVRKEFFRDAGDKNISLDTLRLVAIGNLRQQKNYAYLIDAFKSLPPNVSLDIYGYGDLQQTLQQQIDKYNLPIALKGSRRDIYNVLPHYDLYVMCSSFEGFGIATVEAMASGLPLLLSDLPVLREVTHQNALFFDPHNPYSFVTLMKEILNGRHDLNVLSTNGIRIAKANYQQKDYLEKLSGIYADAIAPRQIPATPLKQ